MAVIQVECGGCRASSVIRCTCAAEADGHAGHCQAGDLDAALQCPDPAATGCCTEDHHHGRAANECPGGHDGAACPEPDPARCSATPEGERCPGGHCGPGVPGCAVCRPVIARILVAGMPS